MDIKIKQEPFSIIHKHNLSILSRLILGSYILLVFAISKLSCLSDSVDQFLECGLIFVNLFFSKKLFLFQKEELLNLLNHNITH